LGEQAERVLPSTNHHANWLEGIHQGTATICSAEIGHRSAAICHLGNIGYRLRRELNWNPDKEQFIGDADANTHLARTPRDAWRVT
ncbi:MAG: gfo/Idh/MocA family oxidoreductase, partial [Pirellulaceae bacterium]|nr:gfo/Idh/MocA family oxidoreductase [Pirellulaceae bacterium]